MAFVYAWIVPLWADQLLPQLLIEQFDTLPIQCRHIEHMHEGVYNYTPGKICLWWVYCFHVVRPSVFVSVRP